MDLTTKATPKEKRKKKTESSVASPSTQTHKRPTLHTEGSAYTDERESENRRNKKGGKKKTDY